MQNLPEGAKYRFGRGVFKQIKVLGDGSRIAVVSDIGIWIYNVYSGETLHFLPNISGMRNHTFSPNGKTLATGSWDRTVRLWDVETGKQKLQLGGDIQLVLQVCLSPDGQTNTEADVNGDGIVNILDLVEVTGNIQ